MKPIKLVGKKIFNIDMSDRYDLAFANSILENKEFRNAYLSKGTLKNVTIDNRFSGSLVFSYKNLCSVIDAFKEAYPRYYNSIIVFYTDRKAQPGLCPFPLDCNDFETCDSLCCNADECSNGYAFRRS